MRDLGAVPDAIIIDSVFCMIDRMHAFTGAGLGVVADAILFDTVCYTIDLVHAFRDAGLGAVTDTIIFEIGVRMLWRTPSYSIACVI